MPPTSGARHTLEGGLRELKGAGMHVNIREGSSCEVAAKAQCKMQDAPMDQVGEANAGGEGELSRFAHAWPSQLNRIGQALCKLNSHVLAGDRLAK